MSNTTSFSEATAVKAVGSRFYSARLGDEWCVGKVPHGGYIASTIQSATAEHFANLQPSLNQPHALSIHLEFLRRTYVGEALIEIEECKVGSQASTVHVSLRQQSDQTGGREAVTGYVTHCNLRQQQGPSVSTAWRLSPRRPPHVDLNALIAGEDKNWVRQTDFLFDDFRKVLSRLEWYCPRIGQKEKGRSDQWARFVSVNGADARPRFTNICLSFMCDVFMHPIDSLVMSDAAMAPPERLREHLDPPPQSKYWYPTLLLNVDIKKALPDEGVEWLFVRAQTKQLQGGGAMTSRCS